MPISVAEFVRRWKIYSQTESAGAQTHFNDLCEMLGEPHPAASDSIGERYAFEKHVNKVGGDKGFVDVWLRDHFAWEYKGKHKDLKRAYKQVNDYREDLGNPPLLVVCDMERFEVHTNFTATSKRVYAFDLDDLNRNQVTVTCPLPPLDVLRALFGDYNILRPERTDARVTQEAAKLFAKLAERLELEERNLGATREQIAHFLMRILFCLFADSIGLLPDHVFRKLLQDKDDRHRFLPTKFLRKLTLLFEAMAQEDGIFGEHSIRYFNGGLFDSSSIVKLDVADLGILYEVSKNYDWSHIAPAIFGTLFERSLDPKRRSLIGAHYTSEEDILLLIEPVIMQPLQKRWAEVKQQVLTALELEQAEEAANGSRQVRLRTDRESQKILGAWIDELTSVRVLDPACGSGNFLYVALRRMLDLWLEASQFAAEHGISLVVPKMVSPSQLYGIETDFYAHELASVVVWIGFLQWKHEHGVMPVSRINPNLTANADTTTAESLQENAKLWAYGSQSKGSFAITSETAAKLIRSVSPFGRDYRQVVKESFNGSQLLDNTTRWVIDFGESTDETEASLYEAPFEYVKSVVKPERENRREKRQKKLWWLHARPSPKYRAILASQHRYVATAATAKHRVFCLANAEFSGRSRDHRLCSGRRLLFWGSAIIGTRNMVPCKWYAGSRSRKRVSLHSILDVRKLSIPMAAGQRAV